MRKILFLSFVLFVQLAVPAQDKIITTSGDTILCRIVSVSDSRIIYEQRTDKKDVVGKMIPVSEVAEYFRAPVAQLSNEMYHRSRTPEQPWLLSMSVGGAYLPWLENIMGESSENNDYKKFNKGLALSANIHYLITNNIGFGVQYSFFTSGYKSNYPTMIDSYYPVYSNSDTRERQYINYAGLSVIFREFLDQNRKLSLSQTLSGGFLLYRAESQSKGFWPYYDPSTLQNYTQFRDVSQNTLVTGNTFAGTIGISAEYKILPYLSVGLGGSFMYGSLSKVSGEYKDSSGVTDTVTDVKLPKSLKLSRIDYSLVVRFQL